MTYENLPRYILAGQNVGQVTTMVYAYAICVTG